MNHNVTTETFEERERHHGDLFERLYVLRKESIGLIMKHQSGLVRTKTINPILTEFEYTMHTMSQPLFDPPERVELFTMKSGEGLYLAERGDVIIKVLYEHGKIRFVASFSKAPRVQYRAVYDPWDDSHKNFCLILASFIDSFIHEAPLMSEVPF